MVIDIIITNHKHYPTHRLVGCPTTTTGSTASRAGCPGIAQVQWQMIFCLFFPPQVDQVPRVPKQGESGGGGDGLGVRLEQRQANNYDQFENICKCAFLMSLL